MPELLLSIIIPCYNVEKYIEICVDSIYSGIDNVNELALFEVILVDDGSSDGTNNICQKLQTKHSTLRLHIQKNQGVSVARNVGMSICKGKFIWFIDADDSVSPGSVVSLLRIIQNNSGVDAVIFGFDIQSGIGNAQTVLPIGNDLQVCTNISFVNGSEVVERYVYNIIGYSQHNLDNLFAGKRIVDYQGIMHGAVWHFLLSRKLIEEKQLSFNHMLRLREDAIFLVEYMAYIRTALLCPNILYHYNIRNTGNMVQLINDTYNMIENKRALLEERIRLRGIYQKQYGIDLFSYYMGSLVLSSLEIMVKGSKYSFKRGLQAIKYIQQPIVSKAIHDVNIRHAPLKYKLPIMLLKWKCYYTLNFLLYIAQKFGMKSPV